MEYFHEAGHVVYVVYRVPKHLNEIQPYTSSKAMTTGRGFRRNLIGAKCEGRTLALSYPIANVFAARSEAAKVARDKNLALIAEYERLATLIKKFVADQDGPLGTYTLRYCEHRHTCVLDGKPGETVYVFQKDMKQGEIIEAAKGMADNAGVTLTIVDE